MSKKTLKCDNILRLIKKVHNSKQSIDLNLVDTNKIVISYRFEHSDDVLKYFFGYKNENDIRLLCIILSQMGGYMGDTSKQWWNMSFIIKDSILVKYNEIWNTIKNTLGIKFQSMPAYDEKYIKAKEREFNDVIKTIF